MPNAKFYEKNKERLKKENAEYQKLHPEKSRERKKRYRENPINHQKELEYKKKYKILNKDKISKYNKDYYEINKEKLNNAHVKRFRERRKVEPKFHLNDNIRSFIRVSLKGKKKGYKWESIVGYTIENLIKHLEKRFDEKMNWENYGSYWSIDHIKPVSLFNYENPFDKEFRKCWALDNLQPMEKIANIKKSNKYYEKL